LQQLIDDGALAGLDRHGQRRIAGGLLAPLLPAGGGVRKVEGGHGLAGGIEDDGAVLLLGPIQAGEMSEGEFGGSHRDLLVGGWGAGVRSPDLRFRRAST
jgi:hypothetical protein